MNLRLPTLFLLVCLLLSFGLWPSSSGAQAALPANLFFLGPDAAGVVQVWSLDTNLAVNQITQEANNILAFDVAYNNAGVYVTGRALVVNNTPVSSGGPLDSPTLSLQDVAWSPNASQVAVVAVAPAGQVDPSEGVWLFDTASSAWTLLLNSSKADPATQIAYTGVEWSAAGDRLLLEANLGPSRGLTLYSLSTGQNITLNEAGTGGVISSSAYSRGRLSLDGAAILFGDVPGLQVGGGYKVDANNFQSILPLIGDEGAGLYLSHVLPYVDGTAFFLRDLQNAVPTTQVIWQRNNGERLVLGTLPTGSLAPEAAWAMDGSALAYLSDPDPATNFGTLNLSVVAGSSLQSVSVPAGLPKVGKPQWGDTLTGRSFDRVVKLVMTEPLFEFLDEAGTRYYSVRLQWNQVTSSGGSYRVTLDPALGGVNSLDVQGVAAKFNRLPCGTNYRLTVAALDAAGAPGIASNPLQLSLPACSAEIRPVTRDLYAASATTGGFTPSVAAPTTDSGAQAALPSGSDTTTAAPAAAGESAGAKVASLTVALPIQDGASSDGTPAYYVDVSWQPPSTPVSFFSVQVSPLPPTGRDRFPVRFEGSTPILGRASGLACNQVYSLVVISHGDDGFVNLATSDPVNVTTPPC
jgi:hypothetical protein